MATEEQSCKVCGRKPLKRREIPRLQSGSNGKLGVQEKCARSLIGGNARSTECYRLGYTREHERAESLARSLEVVKIQSDARLESSAIAAEERNRATDGWSAAEARAEGLSKELEPLRKNYFDAEDQVTRLLADAKDAAARVAELETTLAHVERTGGVEQCLAREARVAELEKQLSDEHLKGESCTLDWSAKIEALEKQLAAAQSFHHDAEDQVERLLSDAKDSAAEFARLRALPDGLREALHRFGRHGRNCFWRHVGSWLDEHAARCDCGLGAALAAPLPSAQLQNPNEIPAFKPLHGKVYFEPQTPPSAQQIPAPAPQRTRAHRTQLAEEESAAPAQPEGAPLAPPSSPQARFIAQLPLAEDAPGIDPDYDDPALAQPQEKK